MIFLPVTTGVDKTYGLPVRSRVRSHPLGVHPTVSMKVGQTKVNFTRTNSLNV